ncbi:MAG TPA: cyclodeaminase/cyclohydrolase family protein, partial [Syntrophorhabdaceae bacterium]|nr:cyclodeaminase/cyclohydrolase family protein [Syntrophorhabdaceae bacterium]
DRDADAFARVMEAYRLPKNTESEKKLRLYAIERALKEAARIPMEVAEHAFQLLEISKYIVENGNRNAITDCAVAVILIRGAILSALYNVKINLLSIKDTAFTDEMKEKAMRLAKETIKKEREILSVVDKIMAGEGN